MAGGLFSDARLPRAPEFLDHYLMTSDGRLGLSPWQSSAASPDIRVRGRIEGQVLTGCCPNVARIRLHRTKVSLADQYRLAAKQWMWIAKPMATLVAVARAALGFGQAWAMSSWMFCTTATK
jgi:hypothetical protein